MQEQQEQSRLRKGDNSNGARGVLSRSVFLLALLGFVVVAVSWVMLSPTADRAEAQGTASVFGWAWSDNVGWISFNCSDTNSCASLDYGVTIDERTGGVSGLAWSDNIGWISFDQSDLAGCPSGACRATFTGNALRGWAKALSAELPGNGGWDGWISLSGPDYGPVLNGSAFEGFAWGADVMGWVDFSPRFGGVFFNTDVPLVSLSADPMVVSPGESTRLEWTSVNVDTCTAFNGTASWDGIRTTEGAEESDPITAPTTFTLSCTGSAGTESDSVTVGTFEGARDGDVPIVSLETNPSTISEGETSEITWTSANANSCVGLNFSTGGTLSGSVAAAPPETTTYTVICSNESGSAQAQAVVEVLNPKVEITADPPMVRFNESSTIRWSARNVVTCAVSGPGAFSFSALSGSAQSPPIKGQTTFTIRCVTAGEGVESDSAEVRLVPRFREE